MSRNKGKGEWHYVEMAEGELCISFMHVEPLMSQ